MSEEDVPLDDSVVLTEPDDPAFEIPVIRDGRYQLVQHLDPDDIQVPSRPSDDYIWGDLGWEIDMEKAQLLIREKRADLFQKYDGFIRRHESEERLVAAGHIANTTFNNDEILLCELFVQQLRDLPADPDPATIVWPSEPGCVLDWEEAKAPVVEENEAV